MKESYLFEYTNEEEFKKYERSLKKYNMLAYKKLYFSYYPSIKEGKFLGDLIEENNYIKKYELKLPTDPMFSRVHGDIKLHYTVKENDNIIILNKITPEGILGEGHHSELTTYKGVMVSKQNHEKDMFKINLLNMISNDGYSSNGYINPIRVEIAKKLLNNQVSIEIISDSTGLSVEEINELIDK